MHQHSRPRFSSDLTVSVRRVCSPGGTSRVWALAALTIREAVRSLVLLGMTALMCLVAAGSLLWPADVDGERVILVQRFCYAALTFFGLIAAAFLGGSALAQELTTKRIYSLAAKPVSRLELLLGKTLGVLGVMLIFGLLGWCITLGAAHVASARATYAGRSYTLEVIVPEAAVRTESAPITVTHGQVLVADGKTEGGYKVTLAQRDTSYEGVIPDEAVRLHVRSIEPQRVAGPTALAMSGAGTVRVRNNELFLLCSQLAPGDRWTFDLAGLELPRYSGETPTRIRFLTLLYEPLRGEHEGRRPPHVRFLFRNPATGQELSKELDFTWTQNHFYEEVFSLPPGITASGTIEARVLDYTPEYPASGRITFSNEKQPRWRLSGFDPHDLPDGDQTLRLEFLVYGSETVELVDQTQVTARVTNPATGAFEEHEIQLRNKTTSFLRFRRDLIDDVAGVELSFTGLRPDRRVGYYSQDTPVYLILTPGSFWASTARSVFLVVLHLGVFAALAVAASTILSAPVAILLTLVAAVVGLFKDMVLATMPAAELAWPANPFSLAARGVMTLQAAVLEWIGAVARKLLIALAPGMSQYSSTEFVNRAWSVPWSRVWQGTFSAALYILVCFALGYVLFRSREFE